MTNDRVKAKLGLFLTSEIKGLLASCKISEVPEIEVVLSFPRSRPVNDCSFKSREWPYVKAAITAPDERGYDLLVLADKLRRR